MVIREEEYVCPVCGLHGNDREDAERCLRSYKVEVKPVFRCSKCYRWFPDFDSARRHETCCDFK